MPRGKKSTGPKLVVATKYSDKRVGIPTAEEASYAERLALMPVALQYPRNPDLDPQLVWRGKDEQDTHPLEVRAYPIYIQEKIHPQTLVKDLIDETKAKQPEVDLFGDFNGVPDGVDRTDFYHYEKNWTNRMILGDSLQVMASLAEKEGLRGKVQCIYLDPPYGIKFNSNFQWSTTSPNQKDGKDITREPEMVRAFRDTWRDGIHSYLSYLRDRLMVARDLLADTGSIFVQIGDENVHRVRCVLDEVFGAENFVQQIPFRKKLMPLGAKTLEGMTDYILFYAKELQKIKYRPLFKKGQPKAESRWTGYENSIGDRIHINEQSIFDVSNSDKIFRLVSQRAPSFSETGVYSFEYCGHCFPPPRGGAWVTSPDKMTRLNKANRLEIEGDSLSYVFFWGDFAYQKINNMWDDTAPAQKKQYVVQTNIDTISRCILMVTDPGDLVLDPTCGSGTTAYVAEQWGRRWITVDTSRVALALARARIMGARFPYYLLADSREGQLKEAEITRKLPSEAPTYGNIRHGFVYERVPHITLKSIANNAEIDVIWDTYAPQMDAIRRGLGKFEEWEVPRPETPEAENLDGKLLAEWWKLRLERQAKIDASIAAHAESEYLYDKPYIDNGKVRVAGPFTVESLDPHRMMNVDENGNLIDPLVLMATNDAKAAQAACYDSQPAADYTAMILENLRMAGVQQSAKDDKIDFETLDAVPGAYVCAEGKYMRGEREIRAGIFIGPEFGTVSRTDLKEAASEAGNRQFDELLVCAFNYDAQAGELEQWDGVPIIKARMNADLHMAENLKTTSKANLFVVFGEPDIDILHEGKQLRVKINGVDIYKPQEGKVVSGDTKDIACWFIDTNYNEESFFVRHAYFLGQNDPYESLRKTLKAEIDKEAWESLHKDISRPFDPPTTKRIAVKIINHLGDEVLKVYGEKDWQ